MRTSIVPAALVLLATAAIAQDRVPDEHWQQFADPAQAGFDIEKLEAARNTWEQLPSSAFMVVADGVVVAAWGDIDRRFMCHSVRKSLLSALYGIYWDRGELELNKTLGDLGMDDEPSPLLETEKTARVLDLLKARSGVFHPAAYAGRTDGRARGSEGPGRYFAYNNWDFNTLATILEMETGDSVFEAFEQHFGGPLGMEDWRVSDGYFHYERDKSKYPAYPFRLSARDAARIGLLFARSGMWGEDTILSRHWVKRSTALYSIDTEVMGYGYMWWVFREPRFEKHGMVSALGVGNQMIAALPDSDLVIVNRANTYSGENTAMGPLLDLIEAVLDARTGAPEQDAQLVTLDSSPDPKITHVPEESLTEFAGEWAYPPPGLGVAAAGTVVIQAGPGHVITQAADSGTFRLYVQPDGSWHEEDSHYVYLPVRDGAGAFVGICDAALVVGRAMEAVDAGDMERAETLLASVEGDDVPALQVARAIFGFLGDDPDAAEERLVQLASLTSDVGTHLTQIGEGFAERENLVLAQALFELNSRVCSEDVRAWNGLAEMYVQLGDRDAARECYEQSLELDPENDAARRGLTQVK